MDFKAVLEPGTAAPPPGVKRAGAVDGVGGGINTSPLGLRGGLVDLIGGLAHGLHALSPKASADLRSKKLKNCFFLHPENRFYIFS